MKNLSKSSTKQILFGDVKVRFSKKDMTCIKVNLTIEADYL
jgi:hypothetical protein